MLLFPTTAGAQATQTVRGQVCDVASGEPMIGVTITIENGTTMATVSDTDGNFVINNVPVGRHSVRATYIGYEPVLLKELTANNLTIEDLEEGSSYTYKISAIIKRGKKIYY